MEIKKLLQKAREAKNEGKLSPELRAKLAEVLEDVKKAEEHPLTIYLKELIGEIQALKDSNEAITKILTSGLDINNLKDLEDADAEKLIEKSIESNQLIREDLAVLGTKQAETMTEVMFNIFKGLADLISGLAKRTTFKVQPSPEHYTIPQMVVVVDANGTPIDWSKMGQKSIVRGGGFSAVQVPGSSAVSSVTVSGAIDGVNTVFTLASTPATGIFYLSLGNQEQVEGVEFTRSGDTITYATAPDASLSGTPHRAIIY